MENIELTFDELLRIKYALKHETLNLLDDKNSDTDILNYNLIRFNNIMTAYYKINKAIENITNKPQNHESTL